MRKEPYVIDTIFTDLGDVMFLFNAEVFKREIERRTHRVPEKLGWNQSQILKRSFTGRTSGKRFLEIRSRELGIEPHEITEVWDLAVTPNKPYLEFLEQWKKEGRRLYLLSNINLVAWDYYRPLPVFQLFDGLFLSYRMRLAKPDQRIFRVCLEKTGVDPARVLFVDDLKENVASAAKLGMATWLYRKESHASFLDFISLTVKP